MSGGYILTMPDGSDDGFLWHHKGRTVEAAQRIFAKPQRWTTLARQGFKVAYIESTDEFRTRMVAAAEAHLGPLSPEDADR